MQPPLALLIDDSREIRVFLKAALEREAYEVLEAADGPQALKILEHLDPSIILLDLMLSGESGLNLIPKIRKSSDAPIVILSGKDNLMDMVIGLEAGADDYINKPFRIQEVMARIKAHVRRYKRPLRKKISAGKFRLATRIKFGDWVLDRPRMQAYDSAGQSALLTVREFKLLEIFVLSPQQVLSRELLMENSRQNEFNVTDRAVDIQILRIRKKLKDQDKENMMIQAVRGIGYLFNAQPEIVS